MAANFWTSSQYEYMNHYTPNLETWHRRDIDMLGLDLEDCRRIEYHYIDQIWEVASSLALRPRIAATASIYFRKFYIEYCFIDAEPSLVAGTALNLAGKIEESPIRIESLMTSAKFAHAYVAADIQSCEFYLLDALRCNLIVFHPYRSLLKYAEAAKLDKEFTEYALQLVNDSYFTDALLKYPPYLITLSCLMITRSAKKNIVLDPALTTWFNKMDLQTLSKIGDLTNEILNVYTFCGQPDFDRKLKEALPKLPKAPSKQK